MPGPLTVDDFQPLVGSPLAAGYEGSSQPLELLTAEPARDRAGAARTGFSLLFRGAPAPVLQQGVYRMMHPTLGALDIFLVPVGSDPQGVQYEAIFN